MPDPKWSNPTGADPTGADPLLPGGGGGGSCDLSGIEAMLASMDAKLDRLLGLCLENRVEDEIVRDAAGNKLSSVIYLYDSAASVATHVPGGGPGLVDQYNLTAAYTANRMTLFKVVRVE